MPSPINLYQLLIPAFALVMIARTYSKWQRKLRTGRELVIQILIWGLVSALSLFPDFFLERISGITGIRNGIYAVIFFLLLVALYGLLVLFMKLEHLERDITELVRREAVEKMRNVKNRSVKEE